MLGSSVTLYEGYVGLVIDRVVQTEVTIRWEALCALQFVAADSIELLVCIW